MGIASLRKQKEWLQDSYIGDELDLIVESWQRKCYLKLKPFASDLAKSFREATTKSQLRKLFRENLFILMAMGCQRFDMLNPWCLDRCNEVQESPDSHVDLWPREHYKSTIITMGMSLFDIMNSHGKGIDVDIMPVTIGIFSYTRPIAKAFLRQIKLELERNQIFHILFDDIFYSNPHAQSPKWSEDEGITVKRSTNPKESTIEAWGLIDAQPTSKHFQICVYDDIVTHDKVRTEYSRERVITAWENSLSLGTAGGRVRYAGTRKHLTDVYSEIMARDAGKKRLYTPWKNKDKTIPVLFTVEELHSRRRKMGEITWAAEYENDPKAASGFTLDYKKVVRHNIQKFDNLNLYMLCDPASGKKKMQNKNDYSAFFVLGLDWSSNLILIDGIRDRIDPSERFDALHHLYKKYPKIITIFYEATGLCSDIGYFKERMEIEGHIFHQKISELIPTCSKETRILKIEPMLTQQRIILPESLKKFSKRGVPYDICYSLIYEEMKPFPYPRHDDMLDVFGYAVENMQSGAMISPNDERQNDLESFYSKQTFNPDVMSSHQNAY